MTPERQELVRLALEMPEGGVATIRRTILWICPGLAKACNPTVAQRKLALLAGAQEIASDPKMLEIFRSAIAELKSGHVPGLPPNNVVELFPAKRG
jgi:hypothetical protein